MNFIQTSTNPSLNCLNFCATAIDGNFTLAELSFWCTVKSCEYKTEEDLRFGLLTVGKAGCDPGT